MKRSPPRVAIYLTRREQVRRKFEQQILEAILKSTSRRCSNFLFGAMLQTGSCRCSKFMNPRIPQIEEPPLPIAHTDGAAEVRIQLEKDSYATLAEGIVHLHLADGSELFSVDANTVQFEKKILGAIMQVFLIGVQRGRSTEQANVRQKLSQIINLVFN
jgi:hypothetical protein